MRVEVPDELGVESSVVECLPSMLKVVGSSPALGGKRMKRVEVTEMEGGRRQDNWSPGLTLKSWVQEMLGPSKGHKSWGRSQ
jgi:hypothetical protein